VISDVILNYGAHHFVDQGIWETGVVLIKVLTEELIRTQRPVVLTVN
jgi:hypothetical protein